MACADIDNDNDNDNDKPSRFVSFHCTGDFAFGKLGLDNVMKNRCTYTIAYLASWSFACSKGCRAVTFYDEERGSVCKGNIDYSILTAFASQMIDTSPVINEDINEDDFLL